MTNYHAKLLSTITEVQYEPNASNPDNPIASSKVEDTPDVKFSYVFRQTDRRSTSGSNSNYFHYCRPYLKTAKILYNGTSNQSLPSVRFNWRYTTNDSHWQNAHYESRFKESVIHEMYLYSGFENSITDFSPSDSPGQRVTFEYGNAYDGANISNVDAIRGRSINDPSQDPEQLIGWPWVIRETYDLGKTVRYQKVVNGYHAIGIGVTEEETHRLDVVNGALEKPIAISGRMTHSNTYSGDGTLLSTSESVWDIVGKARQPVVLASRTRNVAEGESNLESVTYNQYEGIYGLQARTYTWINQSNRFNETLEGLRSGVIAYDWESDNDQNPDTTMDFKQHTTFVHKVDGDNWYIGVPIGTVNWGKGTQNSEAQLVESGITLFRYDGAGCYTLNGTSIPPQPLGDLVRLTATDVKNVDGQGNPLFDTQCGNNQFVTTEYEYGNGSSAAKWQIITAEDTLNRKSSFFWENGVSLEAVRTTGSPAFDPLTTSYQYNDEAYPWQVTDVSTALGTTSYIYDEWGRLTSTIDPTGATTQNIIYNDGDGIFNITSITFPGTELRTEATTYYDGFGRPIATETKPDNHATSYQLVGYDPLGRTICQTDMSSGSIEINSVNGVAQLDDSCLTTSEPTTTTTYDDRLNIVTTNLPNGTSVQQDTTGLRAETTDELGRVTAYINDKYGRLYQVHELAHTSDPYITTYQYNANGHLTQVIDEAGNQSIMGYSTLGQKLSMFDPDMGNWAYIYDTQGNLRGQRDNAGQAICFTYDNLDRMTGKYQITYQQETFKALSSRADCPNTIETLATYTYNPTTGLLESVSWLGIDGDIDSERFTYDQYGRVESHTRALGTTNATEFTMAYRSYDTAGQPELIIYPDGENVSMTYDPFGTHSLTVGNETLVNAIYHNIRGQMTLIDRENGGVDTNYLYYGATTDDNSATDAEGNNLYRLEQINHGGDGIQLTFGGVLPDYKYEYDRVGNIVSLTEGIGINEQKQKFTYDDLNRLESALTDNTSTSDLVAPGYTRSYAYDPLGNIDQIDNKEYAYKSTFLPFVDDADPFSLTRPHAVTAVGADQSFEYDANGNMISRIDESGSYDQVFDVENRLTIVSDKETQEIINRFYYDHSGQRTMSIAYDSESGEEIITYYPFPEYEEIHSGTIDPVPGA